MHAYASVLLCEHVRVSCIILRVLVCVACVRFARRFFIFLAAAAAVSGRAGNWFRGWSSSEIGRSSLEGRGEEKSNSATLCATRGSERQTPTWVSA